jgi:iron-sulfur cluster repair protein YtfE (RIC family)
MALSQSEPGDWLSLVLQHHVQVEDAFLKVQNATTIADRLAAQGWLGVLLTGHAIAEESVLYPALAEIGEKGHADTAYSDQATVKMQMAELERLDSASQEYLDKLEHIRESVEHHVYEEEAHWFPELKRKAADADQAKLTQRYREEFDRYVGFDAAGPARRTPSFL